MIRNRKLANLDRNSVELFLETGFSTKHNAFIPLFLRTEPMTAIAKIIDKLACAKLSTLFFLCTTVALGIVGLALYVVILVLRMTVAA